MSSVVELTSLRTRRVQDAQERQKTGPPVNNHVPRAKKVLEIALQKSRVRSWRITDAQSLVENANDRRVWLNLRDRFPHPYTRQDAQTFLERVTTHTPETNFAIEVSGAAAGGIGVQIQEDVERISCEIGYWLGAAHWGNGIMTEVLRALTPHFITTHSLTRVFALPFATNLASARVLEKAGYVLEGRLSRSAIKDGRVVDQLMYAYVVPE
jgi:[ribosomal protein S5]-alanine N-acetyltransferase